ncbi:hypothetical protein [Chryseolinea lacunae]|uniref:Lipoprotein n=1 Tax=Chryseolinea lacunae TaxID=2801331 RepID=A0ABS1L2B3_9BACT|nr:hypothetical protein [Chryseolinea lacunae]MBL0745824.1 hypothetical protein [Chryseolinea lacunae]
MKTLTPLLVLCAAVFACEHEPDQLFETFVIRAGDHYATGRHAESLQWNVLRFEASFDQTAIYQFDDAGFQDSKNKLMGFSDCNSLHHQNSARFAWQWYHDQLEIYAYCYVNGQRQEAFMGVVQPGEIQRYEIEITNHDYVFRFSDKEVHIARGSTCSVGVYQLLWPYFGGQMPAPHDVSIRIRRF